ncbi:MAG: flagellar type III secretion system pore protein FliP [Kofleriaceae bacterium]
MSNALLLALVAIVPLVVLTLTSFVKISVVLSLVRNAIGAPDAPSGLVVTGLSLILTFFVMSPVALEMVRAAGAPVVQTAPAPNAPNSPNAPVAPTTAPKSDDPWRALVPPEYQPQFDAAERGVGPLRTFLTKHSAEKDRATFRDLGVKLGHQVNGDELWVIAPAFVTTELREAFTIAVLIFIPFLVIDLIVALGLASLGLASTNPQTIALPLKLLLFVAVDGWRLLLDSLLRGYA